MSLFHLKTWAMVIAMTALAGTATLQTYWLRKAYQEGRQGFSERVETGLGLLREIIDPGDDFFIRLDRLVAGETLDANWLRETRAKLVNDTHWAMATKVGLTPTFEVAVISAEGNVVLSSAQFAITSGYEASKTLDRNCCGQSLVVVFPKVGALYFLKRIRLLVAISVLVLLTLAAAFWLALGALARQHRLMRWRTSLMNNTMHELKNPITTLSTGLSLLDQEDLPAGARDPLIRLMTDANHRLKAHCEALSLSASLQKPELQLAKYPENLHALLRRVVDRFALLLDQRKATVDWHLASTTSVIQGDRRTLEILFENLIDNAIRYGGHPPRIQIATTVEDSGIRVAIRDFGPGIGEEHLDQLFEPYFRGVKGDLQEEAGLGLGLSHVHLIAEAHGARIEVDNLPDGGAVFRVWFGGG